MTRIPYVMMSCFCLLNFRFTLYLQPYEFLPSFAFGGSRGWHAELLLTERHSFCSAADKVYISVTVTGSCIIADYGRLALGSKHQATAIIVYTLLAAPDCRAGNQTSSRGVCNIRKFTSVASRFLLEFKEWLESFGFLFTCQVALCFSAAWFLRFPRVGSAPAWLLFFVLHRAILHFCLKFSYSLGSIRQFELRWNSNWNDDRQSLWSTTTNLLLTAIHSGSMYRLWAM